ncbi:Pesticidal crystal-like protein cry16Aa [Gossypium arboreum]|uniref:Pesticidal crystal-like protein cry16Aa n=1 Tax=Gossypium arboreum TaxID=29729 RepID=A0A0B0NAJ2_GOSAR|nr:Pesticidal crystal-like protein cry16Aa [Gossypium arboreum]
MIARNEIEWFYGEEDSGDVEAARGDLSWEADPLVPFQRILEAFGALLLLNFGFFLGPEFGPFEVGSRVVGSDLCNWVRFQTGNLVYLG